MCLAEGVELSKEPKADASETLEMQLVPVAEALELAHSGAIKTAPCALAVLLCERLLRKATADLET